MLDEAGAAFPRVLVLWLHAPPEMLSRRLAGRARKDAAAIRARVARQGMVMPLALECVRIANGGALADAVARALAALDRA